MATSPMAECKVTDGERATVHDLLAQAREGLERVSPSELVAAMRAEYSVGSARLRIIDTRPRDQRAATGIIENAEHIELSVLEWRIDPDSGASANTAAGFDDRLVLVCAHGYSSSLAAARLQQLGFPHATDLIGGMEGWIADGLPVVPAP